MDEAGRLDDTTMVEPILEAIRTGPADRFLEHQGVRQRIDVAATPDQPTESPGTDSV